MLRSWLISGCKKSKYVSPELRKRGRTTRQTECPYQVKIRYLKRESMWKVSEGLAALHLGLEATRSSHNHDPSEHAAIHANNRRPTEAEKQEILRLDRGMTISVLTRPTRIMALVLTVDKGEVKAPKIIQILKNSQTGLELQDSTQAPKFGAC